MSNHRVEAEPGAAVRFESKPRRGRRATNDLNDLGTIWRHEIEPRSGLHKLDELRDLDGAVPEIVAHRRDHPDAAGPREAV